MTTNEKSKKKKDNNLDKTKLWNIFESEIIDDSKTKMPIRLIGF